MSEKKAQLFAIGGQLEIHGGAQVQGVGPRMDLSLQDAYGRLNGLAVTVSRRGGQAKGIPRIFTPEGELIVGVRTSSLGGDGEIMASAVAGGDQPEFQVVLPPGPDFPFGASASVKVENGQSRCNVTLPAQSGEVSVFLGQNLRGNITIYQAST